ncbi:hypothetical protein EF888_15710 [Silicimonas algicola]|uniref:Sulfotransferase family protein n=1 Tax=Silicimonas algicola TaxID=1826607 RepID=A0A316G812_9RHOB|nr:hypothetical protein [Silicimonas algicola]AZQ68449.1 hypothetical protein EF888_15710 [Silicimonas algicola]PWK55850.1 hypothetical protein C8D95_106246 [Silicimonas algicola]
MGNKVVVFVVGMHRSGTSALAGALVQSGHAGPLNPLPTSPDNVKGTFEAREVVDLNERLLGLGCRQWFHTRPVADIQDAHETAVAGSVLTAAFPAKPTIIVKDPRTSLHLPFWLSCAEGAGWSARVAIVCRSPADVARSLQARDGLDIEHGVACWLRHMLEAERRSRSVTRAFVAVDRLMEDPVGQLRDLEMQLGIAGDRPTAPDVDASFIESRLMGRTAQLDAPLPFRAEEAHRIFLRMAAGSQRPDDLERLRAIARDLDEATPGIDRRLDEARRQAFRRVHPFLTFLGFRADGMPRPWMRALLFEQGETVRRPFRRAVFKKNGALRPAFHPWVEHVRSRN